MTHFISHAAHSPRPASPGLARWILTIALFASLALPAARAGAASPTEAFLEKLRERGYYDTVLDYLGDLEKAPNTPEEFKKRIAYERGVTLIDSTRSLNDLGRRESLLDEAQREFDAFLKAQPNHPLANEAQKQLANILIERANVAIKMAERPNAPDKQQRMAQARKLYEEAAKVFEVRAEAMREELKAIPPALDPVKQADLVARREFLRGEYVQSQLMAASVVHQMAATVKDKKEEYKKMLTQAAEMYGEVADKYRSWGAGVFATLNQGRCYQEMGEYDDALLYFEALLQQINTKEQYQNPFYRGLRTQALAHAIECWLLLKQPKYEASIELGAGWIETARPRPNEDRDADWLALRLALADAYKHKYEALEARDPIRERMKSNGVREAQLVLRNTVDPKVKEKAQSLLAALGRSDGGGSKREPTTFVDARDAGLEALRHFQAARGSIQMLADKIPAERDKARREEMEKQKAEHEKKLPEYRELALDRFKLALTFIDPETPAEDASVVRYYVTFLLYDKGDYYEASIVGDFLARKYPEATNARQAAKIAMASWQLLRNEAPEDDRDFETRQIIRTAEYIVKMWDNQPEAQDALKLLVSFMIERDELDQAIAFVNKIPEDSIARGEAELRVGNAFWSAYLKGKRKQFEASRQEEGDELIAAPTDEEMTAYKERAKQTLVSGVERMRKGEVTPTLLRACLALAQIYVDLNEPQKAIELLEDEKVGLIEMVQKRNPLIKDAGFEMPTFQVALRAYIGALPNAGAGETDALMNKAGAIMTAMDKTIGVTDKGQEQLIIFYTQMAAQLEEQMQNSGPEEKIALAKGFDMFLSRVAAAADDYKKLMWVAQIYQSLGGGFDTQPQKLSPEAEKYYKQAIETFQRVLKLSERDGFIPGGQPARENVVSQVQLRMAGVNRRLRQYKEAVDLFEKVLKARNNLLGAQVEAVLTLQEWAGANQPQIYDLAIKGDRMNKATGKNIIWGWGELGKRTAKFPEHRETYHMARYHLALARYNMAMASSGDRSRTLGFAKRDIELTAGLYPEMGGPEWRAKYDALLRNIQKALGEQPTGLDAVRSGKEGEQANR